MNLELAAELCRRYEGYRAKPYLCPAGVATIGYGSTYYADKRKVTLEDAPMDEPTARALLMIELEHTYLPGVLRNCPGLITDVRKCNAIVDFCYNLGTGRLQTSTLKSKINANDFACITCFMSGYETIISCTATQVYYNISFFYSCILCW